MKKLLSILAIATTTFAFSQQFNVVDSDLHWWGYKVAKTAASSHDGTINEKEGKINMRKNKVLNGDFTIDMTSLNTTDLSGDSQQKLNAHLKSKDFFAVDKYPEAYYHINTIRKNKNKDYPYLVVGVLTVKGNKENVNFPAKVWKKGDMFYIESDKFSLDRQDYDVKYQSSMKDVLIKDEIDMKISISAKQQ